MNQTKRRSDNNELDKQTETDNNRQTKRQTERVGHKNRQIITSQTKRQTGQNELDKETDRQTDRQKDRQTIFMSVSCRDTRLPVIKQTRQNYQKLYELKYVFKTFCYIEYCLFIDFLSNFGSIIL